MRRPALLAALALAACQPADKDPAPSGQTSAGQAVADEVENPPVASVTPPKAAMDYARPLKVVGTEPFWAVQIGDTIVLSRPDHDDLTAPNTGPVVSGEIAMWNSRDFTIRLRPADCSDGMSDNRYPYEATVTVEGEVLTGCAAPADDWPSGEG